MTGSHAIAMSFSQGQTGLLRRAPGGGWPAGRAVAPAAMAARLCFSGALAVTAPAITDDELRRAPRPRAVLL